MFTHRITTPDHWYMLMQPTRYHKAEMTYDLIVGNNTVVTPSYDPHCVNDVSGGCVPIEIISGERLVDSVTGPAEGRKIARVLENRTGIENYLIPEDAWECIWTELIVNKKGLKTFIDRPGMTEEDYIFSEEMLDAMIVELNRLITKYSEPAWNSLPVSNTLVNLLAEHLVLIEAELLDVQLGASVRKLNKNDFLGPKTRRAMFAAEEKGTKE